MHSSNISLTLTVFAAVCCNCEGFSFLSSLPRQALSVSSLVCPRPLTGAKCFRILDTTRAKAPTSLKIAPVSSSVADLDEANTDSPILTNVANEQRRVPATEYFKPLVEGDRLESTKAQQAIVLGSSLLLVGMIFKSWSLLQLDPSSFNLPLMLAAVVVGYEFADFGSGVYHWAMDNYGNKDTPIFGGQIEAFQGHHELPWTITHRDTCNNLYRVCQATAPVSAAWLAWCQNPYALAWAAAAIAFINLSQELHKWSHSSPADTHPLVNALQGAGVIVSRRGHLAHHRAPFEDNYCIVSGHCNSVLDRVGFFRGLERLVFAAAGGVEARCWTNERLLADRVRHIKGH